MTAVLAVWLIPSAILIPWMYLLNRHPISPSTFGRLFYFIACMPVINLVFLVAMTGVFILDSMRKDF